MDDNKIKAELEKISKALAVLEARLHEFIEVVNQELRKVQRKKK